MASVEVILREKISDLGAEGDVIGVKRGYAVNYLIPTGRAFEATKGNLRQLESLKAKRIQREAEELAEAEKVASKLREQKLMLSLAIGDSGKAFGSITTQDIASAIAEAAKLEIDRHAIQLDKPIKGTGKFDVPVKVHADLTVDVRLTVSAEGGEAAEAEEAE